MKIEILKAALENYLTTVTDMNERAEVLVSIAEVIAQDMRYDGKDLWQSEVSVVTPNTLANLLISRTYDDYGKLMKSTGSVTAEQYADIIKNKYFFDLTDSSIGIGYDIIKDLWTDNELLGNHNPDGTFLY